MEYSYTSNSNNDGYFISVNPGSPISENDSLIKNTIKWTDEEDVYDVNGHAAKSTIVTYLSSINKSCCNNTCYKQILHSKKLRVSVFIFISLFVILFILMVIYIIYHS